jgi:predicted nucleic acid-binding protein
MQVTWRAPESRIQQVRVASSFAAAREQAGQGNPTAADIVAVALAPGILDAAARATGIHGLRADDAVQLATAEAVRVADPQRIHFACFDAELRDAALREGFDLIP